VVKVRPAYFEGTVCGSPKLAMSRQPGTTMAGVPVLAAASSRSGPAPEVAARDSSAHSVVVISRTPATSPLLMRLSMARPPVPVEWKTRTSYPALSRMDLAWSTQDVVFPNILATMSGLSEEGRDFRCSAAVTMPEMALRRFQKWCAKSD